MNLEQQFRQIILADEWLMQLLQKAASLGLSHWAIAAGAVRSAIWDSLHGYTNKTPPTDIDFIFYDLEHRSADYEREIERKLRDLDGSVHWEAVNQATVHKYNDDVPYTSLEHAMSRWAETATAVGVYLNLDGQLGFYAPFGLEDLMGIVFRPNLLTPKSREVYLERMRRKNFQEKWPKLQILWPEGVG